MVAHLQLNGGPFYMRSGSHYKNSISNTTYDSIFCCLWDLTKTAKSLSQFSTPLTLDTQKLIYTTSVLLFWHCEENCSWSHLHIILFEIFYGNYFLSHETYLLSELFFKPISKCISLAQSPVEPQICCYLYLIFLVGGIKTVLKWKRFCSQGHSLWERPFRRYEVAGKTGVQHWRFSAWATSYQEAATLRDKDRK